MELFVGGRENLGFVDEVDAHRFENPGFDDVANAGFGHDGDRDGGHDLLDHLRVAHAGDAAVFADVRRDALQRHHRDGSGLLGDHGLLDVDDVHDDAAFEHLGQPDLRTPGRLDARRAVDLQVRRAVDSFICAILYCLLN